jgi:hypothetical protein
VRLGAAALAAACLVLAACTAQDLRPRERLDPKTAVHATIFAEPWVYAREVPMLAANARDYLNIGVAEMNRAGERTYWLGVVAWSTIDRRSQAAGGAAPARILLQWSDSGIELAAAPGGRTAVGLSQPAFLGPAESFADAWYPLGVEQLRRLGESPPRAVLWIDAEGQTVAYLKWRARKQVLVEFLSAVGL